MPKFTAIDYAHTPDALENVLKTINDIRTANEQLITMLAVVVIVKRKDL
jgi:UDP-N-acetylmuramoyl-L-alanyl-D-glutamate--2,6-diaminopimelate ligase